MTRAFTYAALCLLTLWLLPNPCVHAAPIGETEELTLAVGENRTIDAAEVKNYSEGSPGIAEVKVTPGGGQFVIVGQRPGTTTLLLLKRDGRETIWKIHVLPQPVQVVASELGELMGDTPGIRVRRVGARFFIEGGVTGEAELKRIEHIAGLYPGQVESLVVLGGVAADRKINLRVDLFFVQYDKNKSLQFGVSWPSTIGGLGRAETSVAYDFLARSVLGAQAALVSQPLPGLDMASRKGWAKLLKHATLLTSNGAEAEFSNGGAQYFQANNGITSTLREINFGTTMKILPRFDPHSGEMQIHIGADTADLTPPLTAGTALPGTNTSKLTTAVTMKVGQCLVLSGIHSSGKRHSVGGIPWLSEIPVLGLLFGSMDHQEEELEGAVLVVPSVIESVATGAQARIDRSLREYENYSGDLNKVAPFDAAPELTP